jgi:hypothetical protein
MTPSFLTIGAGLGGIAFWNTARASRAAVRAAAIAAHPELESFVPTQPSPTTTLRTAMTDVASSVWGKVRKQPLAIRQLEQEGSFEVCRVVTGALHNRYVSLFSARILPDWTTDIMSIGQSPPSSHAGSVFDMVADRVREERDYLPAPVISQVMVRCLRYWSATLLKDDGGVWFLPGVHLEAYRRFADALRPHGPSFRLTAFEIGSDPDTVSHVLSSLRTEIMAGVSEIMDDVLRAEGGMQDRSIALRQARADAFLDKVRQYEGFTGHTMSDLTDAVEKTKQALAVNKLLAASV